MTIEQDYLLASFLDGEAEPDERRRAQAAVDADSLAADTLREMTAVRDLVAGLSRPRVPDLSFRVQSRIAADAVRIRPWRIWGPYLGRGLGAAGVAASLGLAVFLGLEHRSRDFPRPVAARPHVRDAVKPPEPLEALTPAVSLAKKSAPERIEPSPAAPQPPPPPHKRLAADAGQSPAPRPEQPAGLQELWRLVEPRRDFLVNSELDESTTAIVETLLGLSTHRDFYKVEIPGGPEAEEGASTTVAYAARLDPSEFKTLRRRLEAKFAGRLAIGASEPETAALLADVGRATVLAATPAADVSFPQTRQALRTRPESDASSQAEEEAAGSPDAPSTPLAPPDPSGPSVALIWIVSQASK